MNKDDWMNVEQVAGELGVHVETIRKWIREKQLNAVSLGRRGAIVYVDLPWRISCVDGKQCPIRMSVDYSEYTAMTASSKDKKFERVVREIEP